LGWEALEGRFPGIAGGDKLHSGTLHATLLDSTCKGDEDGDSRRYENKCETKNSSNVTY
jgi:hypothetical protein